MAEYRFIENSKKNLLSKRAFKSLPLIIIALIAGLFISFFQFVQMGNIHLFIRIIFPVILLCAGAAFIGLRFGLKIYKESHLDIIFNIENNVLDIIKNDKIIASAATDNIIKIERYNDESIIIFLKNKHKILLNNNIQNYNDLVNELILIHEITKAENKPKNFVNTILSILAIVLLVIFYLTTNRILIIFLGILLIGIIVFSVIKVFLDRSLDKRIKIMALITIFVILEIVKKIVYVI